MKYLKATGDYLKDTFKSLNKAVIYTFTWKKQEGLSKLLRVFIAYTLLTFLIGIVLKILVAYHVDDIRRKAVMVKDYYGSALNHKENVAYFFFNTPPPVDLSNASDAKILPSKYPVYYDMANIKAQVQAIINELPHNEKLEKLNELMQLKLHPEQIYDLFAKYHITFKNGSAITNAQLVKDLQTSYDNIKEGAFEGMFMVALQTMLILLTVAIYPNGLKELVDSANPGKGYTKKMHKRFVIEYAIFIVLFVIIDALSIWLLFKEDIIMNPWNTFSVISVFIPTGFAFGSLYLIRKLRIKELGAKNGK